MLQKDHKIFLLSYHTVDFFRSDFAVITTVTFSYILFSCSVPLHMRSSTGSTKCALLYKTTSTLSPLTNCYSTVKKNSPLLQARHILQRGRARTARTSLQSQVPTVKVRCNPRIILSGMPSFRSHEYSR